MIPRVIDDCVKWWINSRIQSPHKTFNVLPNLFWRTKCQPRNPSLSRCSSIAVLRSRLLRSRVIIKSIWRRWVMTHSPSSQEGPTAILRTIVAVRSLTLKVVIRRQTVSLSRRYPLLLRVSTLPMPRLERVHQLSPGRTIGTRPWVMMVTWREKSKQSKPQWSFVGTKISHLSIPHAHRCNPPITSSSHR